MTSKLVLRPLGQQKFFLYEAIYSEHRISHKQVNPLLERFRESQKACVTNSSRPPANLKGKENPDLPSVCSNYWPPNVALSLCFNHLVLSTFRQCRSAIPQRSAKPIASIHHTVQYSQRNPWFNMITHENYNEYGKIPLTLSTRNSKILTRSLSKVSVQDRRLTLCYPLA